MSLAPLVQFFVFHFALVEKRKTRIVSLDCRHANASLTHKRSVP